MLHRCWLLSLAFSLGKLSCCSANEREREGATARISLWYVAEPARRVVVGWKRVDAKKRKREEKEKRDEEEEEEKMEKNLYSVLCSVLLAGSRLKELSIAAYNVNVGS